MSSEKEKRVDEPGRRGFDRRNLYALLFGLVVALLAGELACRLAGLGGLEGAEPEEERTAGTGVPWAYRPNSTLKYVYPDNPRGYFDAENTVYGTINSFGFRGPETTMEPDSGTMRIAFLGDSFTLGVGVRDEHTLPALVEKDLRASEPHVEVLNFGASGSAPPYQIQLMKERVLDFRPDVVVDVVFLNDAGSIPTMQFISRAWYLRRLRRHSHLANAVIGRLERGIVTKHMIEVYEHDFQDDSEGYRKMKASLSEGARVARENGVQFVIAVYPVLFHVGEDYPFGSIHERIAEFCRSENIPFIDLQPAFAGQRDPDLWVHVSDQHSNEVANELAARRLSGQLNELGVIRRMEERHAESGRD
jgi:lysophospholipase L1-like esterase